MGPKAGRVLSCLIGFRQEGNQPSATATGKGGQVEIKAAKSAGGVRQETERLPHGLGSY